jgi:hypoxanthine phosphoribosyltransferase
MKEKTFLDWQWLDQKVLELTETIQESNEKFKFISGVPRGGLIPGICISHRLGIRYIPYSEAKNLSPSERSKTLVVDDICDSGETLLHTSGLGFKTATLTLRYSAPYQPNFYSEKVEDDSWLVFPWEREDSKTIQDYLA